MSRALRVVLDTNVVLSALVFPHGTAAAVRELWHTGRVVPLVSAPTVGELARALAYPKFKLSADEQHELLADYLPYSETVAASKRKLRIPTCPDPDDRQFLELAAMGRAEALVTGDKELLGLSGSAPYPILSVAELLRRFEPG